MHGPEVQKKGQSRNAVTRRRLQCGVVAPIACFTFWSDYIRTLCTCRIRSFDAAFSVVRFLFASSLPEGCAIRRAQFLLTLLPHPVYTVVRYTFSIILHRTTLQWDHYFGLIVCRAIFSNTVTDGICATDYFAVFSFCLV